MNPELKSKWLEALRSGRFEQATNALRSEAGFCCLGVLCEISRMGEWNNEDYRLGSISFANILPKPVADAAGLLTRNPNIALDNLSEQQIQMIELKAYNGSISLADLNDAGFTFTEIADLIEKHL